ncbi:MAG: polysaccharide biosynthesis protein [Acidimicrobiia bacterium]
MSVSGVLRAPVEKLRTSKRLARVSADCLVWIGALYLASLMRLDFNVGRVNSFSLATLFLPAILLQVGTGWWTGLYRGWWVNGSFEEVAALARATVVTTLALAGIDLIITGDRPAPLSSVIGAGIIAFVGMGGARYVARQLLEQRRRALAFDREKAIIFGAGDGGERTIRAMLFDSDSPYVPVALLDDDPRKRNLTVRGVRVLGDRSDIAAVAARFNAKALIMAVPTGDGALVRELSREARTVGLDVKVVPSVRELLGGEVHVGDLREPTEADLLGRHKVETDLQSVSDYIRGRTVVVTGAGGSIGSELCRQLSAFSPGKLVMIDRDESGLHGVQLSLEGRALLDSDALVLADIRDRERVARLFAEIRPDVVFHAAALKHLPLLQAHPSEALKSNVWGTLSVLDAAAAAGVSHFVNISTDKAANSASVLGYSKRIAEALTSSFGRRYPGRYLSVRFGNVLGSRGSVLTAFRAQLERGGPLTVTHPEVTRYFMTIEEAVQLVIQAGAIGADGHALVLDMGEPVRIYDVARQLAASRSQDVPIEFTGLRPGEKLHEDLFCSDETPSRSAHELIRYVDVPALDPACVRDLDPTQSHEDVLATLISLVTDIDRRTSTPFAAVGHLDLVAESQEAEVDLTAEVGIDLGRATH